MICLITACRNTETDSEAIKRVLEKESATWRSGDVEGHASCWKIQPYSKILISLDDGRFIDIDPALMMHPPKDMMGKGGYAVNSDYHMSIHDGHAWVSHKEESVAKDGQKTYSHEIRMLEKSDDAWKLVGQSIHIYKPTK